MNDPPPEPIVLRDRRDPVVVVPYDPVWPETFATLRRPIAQVLGELAAGIEHVGSTAVPGLAAKPIVDMDVVIRHEDDFPQVAARLAALGYVYLGDLGIAERHAFRATPDTPRHHLYVCAAGSAPLRAHLALRDALRADPALADAYGKLKYDLAKRFRLDVDAYVDGKTAFIMQALIDARKVKRRARRR